MPGKVSRGDVVEVELDPTKGAEIRKKRPCVVIQNDIGNRVYPLTIVAPITGAENKIKLFPVYVAVKKGEGGLRKDSIILCDQIRTVDESRIVQTIGRMPGAVMERVKIALKISLALS
jgi:mRNA interferase MazF